MIKPLKVSEPGLRRLPKYYAVAEHLMQQGHTNISTPRLSEHLNVDAITIRKDLEAVGLKGRPKTGYVSAELIQTISTFLGWNRMDEVILTGCGDLGSALLRYQGVRLRGFKIQMAFDVNPALIGQSVNGCEIFSLERLPGLCKRLHIKIGILTVPADQAQKVADLMVSGGILGIWNFSPTALKVPGHVKVQREDLLSSLSILRKKLLQREP